MPLAFSILDYPTGTLVGRTVIGPCGYGVEVTADDDGKYLEYEEYNGDKGILARRLVTGVVGALPEFICGDRICLRPSTPKYYKAYLTQDGWKEGTPAIVKATYHHKKNAEPMIVILWKGEPLDFPAKYAMEHRGDLT